MSSVASTSPATGPVGLSRQEVGSVLGMSAVFILSADREGIYHFLSDSIEDVLGWEPHELLGKSCYITFHPEEIPVLVDIHRHSVMNEGTASVTYMRLKHKSGEWLNCAVEYSTVLDRSVGTITRAENGPLTIKQRLTAREVFEVQPTEEGRYTIRKWSRASSTPSRSPSPPPAVRIDVNEPFPKVVEPAPRTAYLIDRFTDTSRVLFVTNDVIVSSRGLKDQPFYSIVKPSDRPLVRKHIESVKNWSPVVRTERRSGGMGYAEFYVLKIPDLPAEGNVYPQGTDESERHMPGQEFILVEGIFTGSSDALVCIINRIDRRKGKRSRDEQSVGADRRPGPSRQNSGAASSIGTAGTPSSTFDTSSGAGADIPESLPEEDEPSPRGRIRIVEGDAGGTSPGGRIRIAERRKANSESDHDVELELEKMHVGGADPLSPKSLPTRRIGSPPQRGDSQTTIQPPAIKEEEAVSPKAQ